MFKAYTDSFIRLVFPNLCVSCGQTLAGNEKHICSFCLSELPVTNFWNQHENPIEKLFWGRVPVERAASFLYFEKDSKFQNLLHEIKYRGRKELAIMLGRLFGYKLLTTDFNNIDCIIPIPLHKSRQRKRGYNQSEMICRGISAILDKPVITNAIQRISRTKSQTTQSKYDRWQNVKNAFALIDENIIRGKHILLVDDVITTGATTEAAITEILKAPDAKISLVTLASA